MSRTLQTSGFFHAATLQSAAAATGNGTSLDCRGVEQLFANVTVSSFTGTVTFEGSVDGSTFFAIAGTDASDDATKSSIATAAKAYRFNVKGLYSFRARVSAYTTGTVTVKASAA